MAGTVIRPALVRKSNPELEGAGDEVATEGCIVFGGGDTEADEDADTATRRGSVGSRRPSVESSKGAVGKSAVPLHSEGEV